MEEKQIPWQARVDCNYRRSFANGALVSANAVLTSAKIVLYKDRRGKYILMKQNRCQVSVGHLQNSLARNGNGFQKVKSSKIILFE